MKAKWLLAGCFLALLLCFGCSSSLGGIGVVHVADDGDRVEAKIHVTGSYDDGGLTVRDYFDNETVVAEPPGRVAVLSGTPLNIWYDLGGQSICTSQISDGNLKMLAEREGEMRALPVVGAVYSLDIEAVVNQNPDLIIAQAGVQSNQAKTLREMGFPVVTVLPRSFDDVVDLYHAFGVLLQEEDRAQARVDELTASRQAMISQAPAQGKRAVILYVTSNSLAVKLDDSIAGDIARSLGIVSIASGLTPDKVGSENAPLDIEYIVEQDPDIVLVTSMVGSDELAVEAMETHFRENDAWQTVPAVSRGDVYYLPQEYFLYNAGPYYDEAVRFMACTVYPEIYGDVSGWYSG